MGVNLETTAFKTELKFLKNEKKGKKRKKDHRKSSNEWEIIYGRKMGQWRENEYAGEVIVGMKIAFYDGRRNQLFPSPEGMDVEATGCLNQLL